MNPFLLISAGVFATLSSESEPTIAERITAGVATKIASYNQKKRLTPDIWREITGMIPGQISSSRIDSSLDLTQMSLADQCISEEFRKCSKADLTNGIDVYIKSLPTIQFLNCLSISISRNNELQISLALFEMKNPETWNRNLTETCVNYSDSKVANKIDNIFSKYKPLKDLPCYVRVNK